MKFVGLVAVLGVLALGALIYFDQVQVEGTVTQKGQAQIQKLRDQAADQVRGSNQAK